MSNISYVALSRQTALRTEMDIIANNIANMTTPGFRAQQLAVAERLAGEDQQNNDVSQVMTQSAFLVTDAGPLKRTGNPFDVAIEGTGYFEIQIAPGEKGYIRTSSMKLDEAGNLTTEAGYQVVDDGGIPISIPENAQSLAISRDGVISTDDGEIATMKLVEFKNEHDLEPYGNGVYVSEEGPTGLVEDSILLQGVLEGSNVKPILEMSRMIDVSRSYQSTQNILETEHERERTMIRRLSRTS